MTLATYAPMTTRALPYTETPLELDAVQGVIRGYVFIWGDAEHKDAYSTFFDRTRPVDFGGGVGDFRRPLSLEHNDYGIVRIGETTRVWFDETGLRFEAQLDRNGPYFPDVVRLVNEGRLATSSGTAEHTADFYDDGAFKSWWIVELALTENPAERRMPLVQLVRSAEGANDLSRAEAETDDATPNAAPFESEPEIPMEETPTMTIEELLIQAQEAGISLEELLARLQEMQAPAEEPEMEVEAEPVTMSVQTPVAPRSAPAADGDTLEARFTALENLIRSIQAAPAKTDERRKPTTRTGEGVNVNLIPDERFAHLSAPEMWMVAKSLFDNDRRNLSDAFKRAMAEKTYDYLQRKEGQSERKDQYAQQFMRAYKTKRSDEIMATNIAGQGTEWVGVMYATELWEAARVAPIYSALLSAGLMERRVEPGYNSVYVPTEGADPTWYSSPEANDISSGRIEVTSNPQFVGTGRALITPKTLKTVVAWSEELDEDSIVQMASWLNTQLQRSAQEIIEYVLINGDTVTSATTNLNLIDGTPGTGASRPAYLATDGFIKSPIITTTSMSYDAGNTMSEDVFLEVIKKFPAALQANKQQRLRFILGVAEETAALNIPAVKTRDINTQATIENGSLVKMWGVPVLVSGQMAKANSAGKIAGTNPTTTNIYGRVLAIAPQYWAVAFSRDVRFKVSEDPYSDSQLMRVSLRMGAQYRATNAAACAFEVAV